MRILITLCLLLSCCYVAPDYITSHRTKVRTKCDGHEFSGPSIDEIEDALDFYLEQASEYLPVEQELVSRVLSRSEIVFHCDPIPCASGTCAGLATYTLYRVHYHTSCAKSALFHEITHGVMDVAGIVDRCHALVDKWWGPLAKMRLAFELKQEQKEG